MKTKLQYLTDQEILTFDALVVDVKEDDGKTIVVLDSTYFYPQGGGQPCDQGIIQVQNGVLDVQEVYCRDGVVSHIGKLIQGNLVIGDKVTCDIDESRRILNSRIHSAGHVVDFAARKAGYLWTPSKGFHFTEGSYVEYTDVEEDVDVETVILDLQRESSVLTEENLPVTTQLMTKENMRDYCDFIPDYLPTGKPARVVLFGDRGIPCGGTHINNLKEIGNMTITKVKLKKGILRVSYLVS